MSQGNSWVTWGFINSLPTPRNCNSRPATTKPFAYTKCVKIPKVLGKKNTKNLGSKLCYHLLPNPSPQFKLSQKQLQPTSKMYRQEAVKQISHLWGFFFFFEARLGNSSTLMLGSGLKTLPAKKSIRLRRQPEQKNPPGKVFQASLATCIINKWRRLPLQKDPRREAPLRHLRDAPGAQTHAKQPAERRKQQPLGEDSGASPSAAWAGRGNGGAGMGFAALTGPSAP